MPLVSLHMPSATATPWRSSSPPAVKALTAIEQVPVFAAPHSLCDFALFLSVSCFASALAE